MRLNVLTKNSKLLKSWPGKRVGSVSRTPIKSCPGAPKGGCTFDGKRCYCLRLGKMYPSVKKHWKKIDKARVYLWQDVSEAIKRQKIQVFRPFANGGDFINQQDIDNFYILCTLNPKVKFYAYTKSLHLDLWTNKPDNCTIIQSEGGKYDKYIKVDKPLAYVGKPEPYSVNGSKDDKVVASGELLIQLEAH